MQDLVVFGDGIRIGDDARGGLPPCAAALHVDAAQRDARVEVAAERPPPDAPGVEASRYRLQRVDELHGPHLRRSGHRARGEARSKEIERVAIGSPPAPRLLKK